jgi:hypothetical protein
MLAHRRRTRQSGAVRTRSSGPVTRRAPPLFALLALAACAEPAPAVVAEVLRAVEAGDAAALAARISPDYADPLGGRDALVADLADLAREFARREVSGHDLAEAEGASSQRVRVSGRLEGALTGEPSWRFEGPLSVELERTDRTRVVSGLLVDLRDARGLAARRRAALEGNDAAALVALLHPGYRDGDLDRDGARARLERDLASVRIRLTPSLYRLEVREDLAHLDEHHQLEVDHVAQRPAVARLTLRRSAGRARIAAGLYPSTP